MTNSSDTSSKKCLRNNNPDNKQEVECCPWFINSPQHHNCFWLYVKDKSAIDGSMPELVQSEIAQLLGWSNTKTHFMLKQAMAELIEALKAFNAKDLLSKDEQPSPDIVTFNIEPASGESQDE